MIGQDWDKHKIVGSCLRLPMQVDSDQLRSEIDSIRPELWGERRDDVHTQVDALFVKGYPPVQRKPDEDRPILESLPYLRHIIYEKLTGTPGKCVIAKMKPMALVLMHRDGYMANPAVGDRYFHDYFSSTFRIHIPVVTNDKVLFFCHNAFFHMPAGEVWTVNNLSDHAVINDHPTEYRTHIIVDIHPNAATFELMKRSERVKGWMDHTALERLVVDSRSPDVSPYAKGKLLPAVAEAAT
jgi:hypothetical protein